MANNTSKDCNSCLQQYNMRERMPKILSCYHTYCKSCVKDYMFGEGIVTCLSCGHQMIVASVDAIHDNPYLMDHSSNSSAGSNATGAPEEVYYSDSGEEDDSLSQNSKQENVMNGNPAQGIKDMIINTQKNNQHKTMKLLEINRRKIASALEVNSAKEDVLKQVLRAVDDFRNQLTDDIANTQVYAGHLREMDAKSTNAKNQIGKIDLMNYSDLQKLYNEAEMIHATLVRENANVQQHQFDLEKAVRRSKVQISFEATDPMLVDLQADKDRIFMQLGSNLTNDTSTVFLTTHMLSCIFADKIAKYNANYKEHVTRSLESDVNGVGELDDPTHFIDYLSTSFGVQLINLNGRSSSPPESKPKQSNDEWQVVNTKEKKEAKKVPSSTGSGAPPLSFSEMAKRSGNTNQQAVVKRIPFPEKTIAQTNRPRCYFKIQTDSDVPFRVVLELRPDMAPRMVDNFIRLCKGTKNGVGYKGSKIFRAKADDHILGGDFENNDGTGGHSALDDKYFLAEQCPLKDHKGAIRMKGLERTAEGRCKVGSQFMIWLGDIEYKEYKFTLVFGRVIEGLEALQEISRIKAVQKSPTAWVLRQSVTIVESGVL